MKTNKHADQNNMLLKMQWVNNEIKGFKSEKTLRQMKIETQFPKIYGMQKAILRGKFTAIQAFSNKQPKLPFTFSLEKEEQTKPKVSRRKEL